LEKQQEIENEFKKLQEDIQNLQSLNKELEDPNKMTNTNELQNNIMQSMQEIGRASCRERVY
jgi:peptidoglycan hydrolase CwlO-like protein